MRQNVARGGRRFTIYDKPAANKGLGEEAPCDADQVKDAGNSGLAARRHFCIPFHHFSSVHESFLLMRAIESSTLRIRSVRDSGEAALLLR